jgi:hypothetical protein
LQNTATIAIANRNHEQLFYVGNCFAFSPYVQPSKMSRASAPEGMLFCNSQNDLWATATVLKGTGFSPYGWTQQNKPGFIP